MVKLEKTWYKDDKIYGKFSFDNIDFRVIKQIVEFHIHKRDNWWNDYRKHRKIRILKRIVYQKLKERK
jgi:hypothetical protein